METTQTKVGKQAKRISLELLALDLIACSRCAGTAKNLQTAISKVSDLLSDLGTEVVYTETVVATAAQAEELRFRSSPTVRINGRDLAAELRESPCEECGELCGCGDGVHCRVWEWQGVESREAPVALVIDALLKEYSLSELPSGESAAPFSLSPNLRSFFQSRQTQAAPEATCCDRETCCEQAAKAACCGQDVSATACGCK